MPAFRIYLIGFSLLLAGLCLAAYLLGMPPLWIIICAIIASAIGYIFASSRDG